MIVVADTSVLLNLCCVQQEGLLLDLFQQTLIPPAVAREFDDLARRDARFVGLAIPQWVIRRGPASVPQAVATSPLLHAGEQEAIALAIETGATLLVDERNAYKIARDMQIGVVGLLGVLLHAKSAGFISAIAPILQKLESNANFWIAPAVRHRVLSLAGEAP